MSISDDQMLAVLTELKEGMGRVEGTLKSTISAYDERFKTIEEDAIRNETRSWIVSAAVIPVVTALHYFANKVGFKV